VVATYAILKLVQEILTAAKFRPWGLRLRLVGRSQIVQSVDIRLGQGVVTVGSEPGNTVVAEHAGVDPHHATIRKRGREWWLEDLESHAGTYLNGIRVIGRQQIRPGDRIECGPILLEVVAEAKDKPLRPSAPAVNVNLWLGGALTTVVVLTTLIVVLSTQRFSFRFTSRADGGTAVVMTNTATAQATSTPIATAGAVAADSTQTPTATSRPSATRPRPTPSPQPSATNTPVATATSMAPASTLAAVLTSVPQERAAAAATAVATLGLEEQREVVATVAAYSPKEVLEWVRSLLREPLSPAGRIAYGRYSPGEERYDVVLHDLSTGEDVTLLTYASQPAFDPGGDSVAYKSWRSDALGLYALTLEGEHGWRLTRDAHPEDGWPSWSPDGSQVAFASLRYGDGKSRIYVVPAAGGAATGISFGEHVDWSPDGTAVALKGCIGGACGILVANADGSNQRLLSSDASDGAPSWSPDGEFIAFHSHREGNWDIFVMRADGSELHSLVASDADEVVPEWSPDGRYLAFRSNCDGEWAVWIVRPEDGETMRLVSAPVRPGDETSERLSWIA